MKLRFSIRDAMWLLVILGLAIGWGIDHWLTHGEMSAIKVKLKSRREEIQFLYEERDQEPIYLVTPPGPGAPIDQHWEDDPILNLRRRKD